MILLFDIGNTHTHLGLANDRRVIKQVDIPTSTWFNGRATALVKKFAGITKIEAAVLCSVVPRATPLVGKAVRTLWKLDTLELTPKTIRGVGIDYPKPHSIGPDRLANAVAARFYFGAPVVVVDFGTAVTFDVVDASGNYIGGIIAPGLAAMTDYLHEENGAAAEDQDPPDQVRHRQKHRAGDARWRGAWLSRAGKRTDRQIETGVEIKKIARGRDWRLRQIDCGGTAGDFRRDAGPDTRGLAVVWENRMAQKR
ncbi:MAG: type III pantothenate kinase [Limisphaerales bacterium]